MTGWNPVPFPESLALTSCSSKKNYYHAAVSMQLSFTYTYIHDYVILKERCIQIFLSSFGHCIPVSSWQQRMFFFLMNCLSCFCFLLRGAWGSCNRNDTPKSLKNADRKVGFLRNKLPRRVASNWNKYVPQLFFFFFGLNGRLEGDGMNEVCPY